MTSKIKAIEKAIAKIKVTRKDTPGLGIVEALLKEYLQEQVDAKKENDDLKLLLRETLFRMHFAISKDPEEYKWTKEGINNEDFFQRVGNFIINNSNAN